MPEDYLIRQGESVRSIAFERGFTEETLWNLPENKELKDLRKDPNVLLEGDKLHIPDLRPREENRSADSRHKFKKKGVPAKLKLRILEEGKPLANTAYVLMIDGKRIQGKTDSDGNMEQSVPPNSSRAELQMEGDDEPRTLLLSHLDPHDTPSGIKGRLKNLGFIISSVGGEIDEEAKRAIELFQSQNDLEPTGEVNDAFLQKLEKKHGA
jgi:hypothetical protein